MPGRNEENKQNMGAAAGEMSAKKNGWEPGEEGVLGYIGVLDDLFLQMKKEAGPQEQQDFKNLEKMLRELKLNCNYKSIETQVDKQEIIGQIGSFREACAEIDHPIAKKLFAKAEFYDETYKAALRKVKENIDLNPDGKTPQTREPIVYLLGRYEECKQTGDFHLFVHELTNIQAIADRDRNGQLAYALDDFIGYIEGTEDRAVQEEILRTIIVVNNELSLEKAQAVELYAQGVMDGSIAVSNEYEHLKYDFNVCSRIGEGLTFENGIGPRSNSLQTIRQRFVMNLEPDHEFLEDCGKRFLEMQHPGLTANQKMRYVHVDNNGASIPFKKFGIRVDAKDPRKVVKAPDEDLAQKQVQKEQLEFRKFEKTIESIRTDAKALLARLDKLKAVKPTAIYFPDTGKYYEEGSLGKEINPKKANSKEFMDMYNSVKALAELKPDATLMDMTAALEQSQTASLAYNTKIKKQTFAAVFDNGKKRVDSSVEIQDFAKKALDDIVKAPLCVSMNESMQVQKQRMMTNVAEVNAWAKEEHLKVINTAKTAVKDAFLKDYDPNIDFKENKERLITGMARTVVLFTMEKAVQDDALFTKENVSDAKMQEMQNAMVTSANFAEVTKSILTEEDCKKYISMMQENPGKLIDMMAKKSPVKQEQAQNPVNENVVNVQKQSAMQI